MNKWGRIVSKKKHATAKKEKRLQKFGFFAKKGSFGYVRKTSKRRGGSVIEPKTTGGSPLTPQAI
jgi:hypothetical protein